MARILIALLLLLANVVLYDARPVSADSSCQKDCGAGELVESGHRDCDLGENLCHVTLCSQHHMWGGHQYCWSEQEKLNDMCSEGADTSHYCFLWEP